MIEPVTIGRATLYCGDCLTLLPALGAVDHIITDPPYEAILHNARKENRLAVMRSDGGPATAELPFDAIDGIRAEIVSLCGGIIERGWFIAFCTPEGVGRWADDINASPLLRYKRACVWVKPDAMPQINGQGPAMGAENFIAAWAGSGCSKWNAGGKRGVYTHCTNSPERHGEHPTEKPRRLMAEIIKDFTSAGQLICDPFMGSGTTGVAAVQMERDFIGIEKEPRWFDIACRRIEEAQRQGDLFLEGAA